MKGESNYLDIIMVALFSEFRRC